MTAYEQRSYPGAAPDTALAAGITATSLSITVTAGTGTNYPTGASGPFFLAIDYDNSKEEKVRVTSRSGDTFTVASTADRGVDGTTAVGHDSGAKVRACWTATDAQEANRAAANTVGKVTSKGDLLVGTAANSLTRLPVGANGTVPVADDTQPGGWRVDVLPVSKTIRIPHTFTVHGAVAVASGDTDYIIPFYIPVPTGQTVTLTGARSRLNAGTSATVKLQKNGVDISGFTGISATTTPGSTSGSAAFADGDLLALVVTAVAGGPTNMTFTCYLDYVA